MKRELLPSAVAAVIVLLISSVGCLYRYHSAYKEPADVAFPRKADVDANFVRLSCILLDSPIYHGLATHDDAMIAAIKSYAGEHGIEPSHFEFQMLYGIKRDLQRKLVQEGYKVR